MEVPSALASLGAHLESHGYRRSSTRIAESFGDVDLTYEGPLLGVRVFSDRGEDWFVEIGRLEWDDWYDADVWRACVEGGDAPLKPRDLAAQADYISQHIDDLAAAATKQPDLFDCLRRVGTTRAMSWIG